MFIGHYGISFLVKRAEPRIPIWVLFMAVQFLDLLWGVTILLGIEQAEVTAQYRGSLPLVLSYMPYTHSLVAAIFWSVVAGFAYHLFRGKTQSVSNKAAILVGLAVLSHWILDFVVHRSDLPLYDNSDKVGLAFWDYAIPALALEVAIYFGGLWFYLRSRPPTTFYGKYGFVLLGLGMLLIQIAIFWWPILPTATVAAIVFLVSYFQLAAIAGWLEKKEAELS